MSTGSSSLEFLTPWDPGQAQMPTVLERYRILGTIGRGGMGIVFKAFHLSLERHVAIKTLRIDKISTPELVNRFRQEIKLVGQMDHDNVVRATDAGERNGVFYLVMEYLPGLDLDRVVARNGALGAAFACELVRQAALGLEYIHQKLVHRDIKPSNLMLTSTGQVKILDLGLAHGDFDTSDELEQTPAGYAVGTRSYMAPEQAQGSRAIDRRADIYSLGCTLFKLLTGKAPYSGPAYNNTAKMLYAHCHVPLTEVPAFETIPEPLRPLLLRMTAKDPDERYQSGREVAEALSPFAEGGASARQLSSAAEGDEVKPLTPPLPEELSRLTQSVVDTPYGEPTVSMLSVTPRSRWAGSYWAVGLVACIVLLSAGIIAFAIWRGQMHPIDTSPPSLDTVKRDARRELLDRQPWLVGWEQDQPRWQTWSPAEMALNVMGGPSRLLLLGTTSLPSYQFEVEINQSPWSGEVGVFWGLNEDPALKAQQLPRQEFAWFHFLRVAKSSDGKWFVHRGKGNLRYNQLRDVAVDTTSLFVHPIPRPIGRQRLKIEVKGNRLASAEFGQTFLADLCSDAANNVYQAVPYQGGIGLLPLSHAATFRDARFVSLSNP